MLFKNKFRIENSKNLTFVSNWKYHNSVGNIATSLEILQRRGKYCNHFSAPICCNISKPPVNAYVKNSFLNLYFLADNCCKLYELHDCLSITSGLIRNKTNNFNSSGKPTLCLVRKRDGMSDGGTYDLLCTDSY